MVNQLEFVRPIPIDRLGLWETIDDLVVGAHQMGLLAHRVLAGSTNIALVKSQVGVVAVCDFLDRGRVEMRASGYLQGGSKLILCFPDGSDFEFKDVRQMVSAEEILAQRN